MSALSTPGTFSGLPFGRLYDGPVSEEGDWSDEVEERKVSSAVGHADMECRTLATWSRSLARPITMRPA